MPDMSFSFRNARMARSNSATPGFLELHHVIECALCAVVPNAMNPRTDDARQDCNMADLWEHE